MSNELVAESEVKQFMREWFSQLDIHPPVAEMLPFVADEKLSMKMPERTFYGHEGFKEWYQGVRNFVDQIHSIKGLRITSAQDTAKVEVVLYWKRSVLDNASGAGSEQAGFYVAQTWELERLPQPGRLRIVTYNVDYFLPEVI